MRILDSLIRDGFLLFLRYTNDNSLKKGVLYVCQISNSRLTKIAEAARMIRQMKRRGS